MTFEEAVSIVIKEEGGYSFNKNDPGGETKFGISRRAYPSVNIKELTINDAGDIYRRDYWDKLLLDRFPPEIRLMIFDCAVNQGVSFAIRTLQTILGVNDDGLIGQIVLTAVNQVQPKEFLEQFIEARNERYSTSRLWPVFGPGWAKRLALVALYCG